jgi:PAS domain S-box-containing protein
MTSQRRSEKDRSSGAMDPERAALRDEIESHAEAVVWLQELDPLVTIHATRAYEVIWGRSLGALYENPRDWIEAIHPEDRPRVEAAYERLLLGEAFDERYRIRRPDGAVRWIRDRGSPLPARPGISKRIAGIAEDVTEKEQAEAALRRMSTVFSAAADPILIEDLEGRVVECNDEAVRAYGWSRKELLGQPVGTIVPPERQARIDELRARCRAGADVRNVEGVRYTKTGERIPVLLTLSLLRDESGVPTAIVNVAKDISELNHAESRRRGAARAVERAEANERRALARDLHDSVSQSLALARTKLAALRDEAGESDRAVRLREVESLIADAEGRTQTLTFRLSPPVLHDLGLVEATEWLAQDLESRFGLHVSVRDDELPKPLAEEAREALFRSLRELLINVARHARTDKASVSLIREDDTLTVTVGDGGIGFDRGRSGAGFGLVSVRERVEGLGGRLEIDSEPNRGARVRMMVPLWATGPP